jgi:hypothetical protein
VLWRIEHGGDDVEDGRRLRPCAPRVVWRRGSACKREKLAAQLPAVSATWGVAIIVAGQPGGQQHCYAAQDVAPKQQIHE